MQTDLSLQEDIAEQLASDPRIDAALIGVAANDGIVTLTGRIPSYAQKLAAEQVSLGINGVKALAMDLEVALPSYHERDDTEVAAAALQTLAWDITIPREGIVVEVEHGWVVLRGTTQWQFECDNAERDVSHLVGVKGVSNLIDVAWPRPGAKPVLI